MAGDNGHGKTTILEAIYLAATSRSFRTTRAAELVAHAEQNTSVHARFADTTAPGLLREQAALVTRQLTSVRIDGARPGTLAEFATRSPIVVFHPRELELSSGAAARRRTLLDRLALFIDPASADHRLRYTRALRSRQQILRTSRSDAARGSSLEAFEELCAVHGAALTVARAQAVEALTEHLLPAFARIAAPDIRLSVRFSPGGSADLQEARAELVRQRPRDAHRPNAGFGPHRDDIDLRLDEHAARLVASQGQHRAITLALKAAEASAIAAARGIEPILLLDDVSSELDAARTASLFEFLGGTSRQMFLTTTRPELILTPGVVVSDRRDFLLRGGALVSH